MAFVEILDIRSVFRFLDKGFSPSRLNLGTYLPLLDGSFLSSFSSLSGLFVHFIDQ